MDRIDGLVVDLIDDEADLGGDLTAGSLEDSYSRFLYRRGQGIGNGTKRRLSWS